MISNKCVYWFVEFYIKLIKNTLHKNLDFNQFYGLKIIEKIACIN